MFHAGGAVTVVIGAVRSILTAGDCAFVLLPARSDAVALAVSAVPSPPIVLSSGSAVPEKTTTTTSPVDATYEHVRGRHVAVDQVQRLLELM